ncbi:recombinase family protein [Janibacter melonis]|uniref:recombinase family protein n=1 Tax=Janibacter melonis TaxID=262209 RepID=UPI002042E2DE|nr:recombinase family protein [Janibacter melonis]MCM3556699.1 recombinase family protein [Janibacter melonis]
MTEWGYARVSTLDQDTALQFDALRRAGVDDEYIVTDHASGSRTDRPGLARLLERLEPGDVLTVWKLDRLGRSLKHLISVVDELGTRGVEFRSLTESLDTTTPGGRLLFHVMASVAQFEREMTAERTRAALAAARAKGGPLGRPSRVTAHQFRLVHEMAEAGKTQGVIASTTGLSRAVVGRVLRGEIASLARFDAGPEEGTLPLYRGDGQPTNEGTAL